MFLTAVLHISSRINPPLSSSEVGAVAVSSLDKPHIQLSPGTPESAEVSPGTTAPAG